MMSSHQFVCAQSLWVDFRGALYADSNCWLLVADHDDAAMDRLYPSDPELEDDGSVLLGAAWSVTLGHGSSGETASVWPSPQSTAGEP